MLFYVSVPVWLFIAGVMACVLQGAVYFEHGNARQPNHRISNIFGGFSVFLISAIILTFVFTMFFHGITDDPINVPHEVILFSVDV